MPDLPVDQLIQQKASLNSVVRAGGGGGRLWVLECAVAPCKFGQQAVAACWP